MVGGESGVSRVLLLDDRPLFDLLLMLPLRRRPGFEPPREFDLEVLLRLELLADERRDLDRADPDLPLELDSRLDLDALDDLMLLPDLPLDRDVDLFPELDRLLDLRSPLDDRLPDFRSPLDDRLPDLLLLRSEARLPLDLRSPLDDRLPDLLLLRPDERLLRELRSPLDDRFRDFLPSPSDDLRPDLAALLPAWPRLELSPSSTSLSALRKSFSFFRNTILKEPTAPTTTVAMATKEAAPNWDPTFSDTAGNEA